VATLISITDPDLAGLSILFETVSAFGTVGLSMGITAELSSAARAMLVLLMLAGRVGLLTVALALVEEGPVPHLRYPSEDVVVG
jgi:trk system potassium uptake protein